MKKSICSLTLFFAMLFTAQHGFSQSTSWKGTSNTYWNNALNWTNGVPDATKDAILGDASFTGINQPKNNVAGICKSITVGGIKVTNLTLTRAITVNGNIVINANGTVTHPGVVITLMGNWSNNGNYVTTAATSKTVFAGTSQSIGGTVTTMFRRLTINLSSTVILANNINVGGASSILDISGTIDPGQSPTYSVTSSVSTKINTTGKIKINAATFASNYLFTGTVTFYGGSTAEYSSTTVNQTVSSAYFYSTLMISGTGTKSLAANLPLLYGKSATTGIIYVSSGIFDMGVYTANRATTVAGGEFHVDNGGLVKMGGANNFPLNYVTKTFAPNSTIEYNGNITQTVSPQTYGNLLISGSGDKNALTAFTTTGNLTITSGNLNTAAIVVNHSISGNFTMTGGTVSGTNSTYTLTGAGNQSLSLLSNLLKLTINKTGGVVNLASDIRINTTLTFTKGIIQTGSFSVIAPPTCTIAGAGQSTGWVYGNLQKNVTTGSSVFRSFEIGDVVSYLPTSILFSSVGLAGELKVSAGATDHSEIDYSGIDPAKTVNRYWSLNNAGILFTNAIITFNWQAAALDAGTTTTNFKTGEFNGTNWMLTSFASALPTSIQATNITALGEFAIGEKITRSTWNGNAFTSDWFTPKNWLGGIPSTAVSTLIPAGITGGRVYPVLTAGTATVNDITVESAAALTIAGTLKVSGDFTNAGTVTASAGTVEYNGSAAQNIPAGLFAGDIVKNLLISNDVSLDGTVALTGTLSVAAGKTLATNDNLVLKSNAAGTARIDALPVNGSGVATAFITGKVSIERYIAARKAWRLLSVPIVTGATTIQQAWQEDALGTSSFGPNENPNPGYGVHIMGGAAINGFDQSPTNSPSLKVYNNSNNTFEGLPPVPGTNVAITNYTGYLIYIRGDRGIDLSQGVNAAITQTTLRMKGQVNTGNKSQNVNAINYTVFGNPYPSAIDFQTLTKNNVKNTFYVWDPKLAGANGLGAYATVSWNSGTGSYDVTASVSPVSQYIPSGEAVLVESLDGVSPGSIVVHEADKTSSGSDALFGRNNHMLVEGQSLRTDLYAINANGTESLLDGILTTYADRNSNDINVDDAKNIGGSSEDISIKRDGKMIAIERRKTITANDTTFLNVSHLRIQSYKLVLTAINLGETGMIAVVKDKYSATTNNLPLDLTGTTNMTFTVNADPASYAVDRFSVIFYHKRVAPLTEHNKMTPGNTVKLMAPAISDVASVVAYPNPVTGKTISILLNNLPEGSYTLQLYNSMGQVIAVKTITQNAKSTTQSFEINNAFSAGAYELKLDGKSIHLSTSVLKK